MNEALFEKCRYLKAADWYELSRSLNKPYPYTLLDKEKLIILRDREGIIADLRNINKNPLTVQ